MSKRDPASESRTIALLKGTLSVVAYQVVAICSGFILPKVMMSYYGSAVNGLVSSVTQLMNYAMLIEAGLTASLIFSLYKPLAENDHESINGVYSAGWKYYNRVGTMCYALIVIGAVIYPFAIESVDTVSRWEIFGLILSMGVPTAMNFWVMGKYNIIITADKKMYVYNFVRILYVVLFTVIVCGCAVGGISILFARIIAIIATVAQGIVLVCFVQRNYPYLSHRVTPNESALSLRKDAFLQEIATTVQVGAPSVILTVVTRDMLIVSVYAVYNVVINGITALISLLGSGLTAILGDLVAQEDKKALNKAFSSYETLFSMASAVLFAVSFVMIMPFIRIYTMGIEDTNYDLPMVGFLAVLNALIYTIQTPERTLVKAAGLYRETRVQALAQTAICLILGSLLSVWFSIYGVLIGMLLANAYRCVDLLLFTNHKILSDNFISVIKKWILILVVSVLIYFADYLIAPIYSTYLDWLIYAVVYTLISGLTTVGVYWLVCRDDVRDIIQRIGKIFRNKEGMSV